MPEQFKVEFVGNDKLSPVITKITDEMMVMYNTANGSLLPAINQINQAFANSGNIRDYANAIATIAKSSPKLGQIDIKFNNAQQLISDLNKLNIELAHTLVLLKQIDDIKLNIKVPKVPSASGDDGGGRSGSGSGSGSGGGGGKQMTLYRGFEHVLHVFNSLTFAIGTVTIGMQNLFQLIERGNEVTRAQSTMMALIASQGYEASKSTNLYNAALSTAMKNQLAFGGTLASNIDNLLKIQQMSHAYGVSVREINDAIQLLSLRDPVQGIEGATIAIQELMSGDPMSLRRRFELPADEVNKIAKQSGNASIQISQLTQLLQSQGISAEVLASRLNNTAASYRRLEVAIANATDTAGSWLALNLGSTADRLTESLSYSSLGMIGFNATLTQSIDGVMSSMSSQIPFFDKIFGLEEQRQSGQKKTVDLTKLLSQEQRIMYEEYVRSGAIINDVVKERLDNEEKAYQYSHNMQMLRAAEAIRVAMEMRDKFAGIYAGDYSQSIGDSIEKIKSSIDAKRLDLHITAATKLATTDYARAAQVLSLSLNLTTEEAKGLIDAQILLNNLTEDGINKLYGIESAAKNVADRYKDLATSLIASNEQQLQSQTLSQVLAANMQLVADQVERTDGVFYDLGYTAENTALPIGMLIQNAEKIAQMLGLTTEQVVELIRSMHQLNALDLNTLRREMTGVYLAGTEGLNNMGQAYREMIRAYQGVANTPSGIYEKADSETKKRNRAVKDNNDRMLEMQKEANEKIVEYDKDMYRKRIRDLQAFYAEMVTTLQRNQYEMTANDLDLIEGKNKKLDDKDRQRLLARENIEAYSRLQLLEATNKANQMALNGQGKFAKEYLSIEQSRIKDIADLNWKLHDTKVRLDKDPEAQQRAQEVYDKALGELNTYYNTRIGLAQAAVNQEAEEEREARREMIQDAIDGVLKLENVDEAKRKSIVDGLEIAKSAITDLSGVYVSKVDAMRGSLALLAQAMANVRENASILTPEQLNMFNSIGSGAPGLGGGGGGDVTISTTTVNVGGISVSVTSQADPNEIATTVLKIIQSQQNTRGG